MANEDPKSKGAPPEPPPEPPPDPTPPPPSEPPPTPPDPPTDPPSSGGSGKSDNTVMLVLAYLWILCLIPLLAEKNDKEVQWHAKHGVVLCIVEIILYIILTILSFVGIGCLLYPLLSLGSIIVRILAIVKATKGERFIIKGISDYTEKL